MPEFNFTSFFEQLGRNVVLELKERMVRQIGTDNQPYEPVRMRTFEQKRRISEQTADKRMIRTKDFLNNAFQMEPLTNGLRVFISSGLHGRTLKALNRTLAKYAKQGKKAKVIIQAGKVVRAESKAPTYQEIAVYQLGPEAQFFPANDTEALELDSVRNSFHDFEEEAGIQIRDLLDVHIRQELVIG